MLDDLRYSISSLPGFKPLTDDRIPLAVVILPRRGRFHRERVLNAALRWRPSEILWVEVLKSSDSEQLLHEVPGLRILHLNGSVSIGEMINIAVHVIQSAFALVQWSDQCYLNPTETLLETMANNKAVVHCPRIQDHDGTLLPTRAIPHVDKQILKVEKVLPKHELELNFFPHDYAGLYHVQSFKLLGGYDDEIAGAWWQKLDFACRTLLWGETIVSTPGFHLKHLEEETVEDTTPDESYARFFAKNMLLRFVDDRMVLPKRMFRQYRRLRGIGYYAAKDEFHEIRNWVNLHSARFRSELFVRVEMWETASEELKHS